MHSFRFIRENRYILGNGLYIKKNIEPAFLWQENNFFMIIFFLKKLSQLAIRLYRLYGGYQTIIICMIL
jgi:hypothetical protein